MLKIDRDKKVLSALEMLKSITVSLSLTLFTQEALLLQDQKDVF